VQYNSSTKELTTSNILNFDLTVNGYITSWQDYTMPPPFPENTADRTSITGLIGTDKWSGGALAPNGKIYCVPLSSLVVLIIDPATDTANTTTITGIIGTSKYQGAVLGQNGLIYAIPRNAGSILVINPATNTTSSITGALTGSTKYLGGVLAPNGIIYGVPRNSADVLLIRTSLPTLPDWPLQAYFNKF
jgi:hypothetical protein